MKYKVEITRKAQKALAKIPQSDFKRVTDAIRKLAQDPRPPGCKQLTGRNAWRIRAGDYRVLYEVRDAQLVVIVVRVGHRRDVYR